MSIKDWPEDERPRERLLARGAEALTDAELLAIFLRTGVTGRSAIDLARDLLAHFGGLRGLLAADVAAFSEFKGMGSAKYAQLQASLEMSRRYLLAKNAGRDVIANPDAVREWLTLHLRDEPVEIFGLLMLDTQNAVICFEKLFSGTLNQAAVYPREVVKRALAKNAASVILVHNHPSGISEPSHADRELTDKLKSALATVEVRVLDHLIVGEETLSFSERGLI